MSKSFGQQAAEVIAAAIKANSENRVNLIIRTTGRGEEVVTLKIPQMLEKSQDFHKTLLDLGVLPSVVFSNNQNQRKTRKSKLAYIVFIENNNITNMSNKDLRNLLNTLDLESKNISDVAPFIWNAFVTWNNLHDHIRSHRKLTEDMVGGYLKQLQTYSHREILDMIETYGKWASAYYAMVDAEELRPIWFHNSTFSALLRSNKMFANHLEGGWKQLIRDKQIPDDYIVKVKTEKDVKEAEAEKQKTLDGVIRAMAQDFIEHGQFFHRQHLYEQPDIKREVDKKIAELKNV